MTVNGFLLNENIISALETSLSPERMATYFTATGGDPEKAFYLYTWNTAVSAAFYGPLQGLEVALRNAMHRELAIVYGQDWYDNPKCQLDAKGHERVNSAKRDLEKGDYRIDPPHVVAALSFGFWVSLLGSGGRVGEFGSPRANYEMVLWRPALYRAFSKIRRSRSNIHRPLDFLRILRNRIAHHEPIFTRHLAADHASILEVTGWICPETRDWIEHHSRVPEILTFPRDANTLKF
jgi:hypothetical protein